MNDYPANSLPLSLGNKRRPLRITVVRTCGMDEIFGERPTGVAATAQSACPLFQPGDAYTVTDKGGKPPAAFPCGEAWHSLFESVLTLQLGGDLEGFAPGCAYVSCADGLHPVVFRLERLD